MATFMKTSLGRDLSEHYSKDALRQIRDWAQSAEEMLNREAETAKKLSRVTAEDFEHDAELFRKLGSASNRMILAITKAERLRNAKIS